MFDRINDNTYATLLEKPAPILVAYIHFGFNFNKQIQVVKQVSEMLNGKVSIYLLDDTFINSFSARYRIYGSPTFLLLKKGVEIDRLLGEVDENTLFMFLTRNLPAG
jgi:3'-phosphoadenosine 5'-phosphosulfate sulfotransferase (PAPS reductase)/FAD synthetase